MTLCQRCRRNAATVHETRIERGASERIHLCAPCAGGEVSPRSGPPPGVEMACELCRDAPATVHFTAREGGRQREIHACRPCIEAAGRGILTDDAAVRALTPLPHPLMKFPMALACIALAFGGSASVYFACEGAGSFARPILLWVLGFTVALTCGALFGLGRRHARRRKSAPPAQSET